MPLEMPKKLLRSSSTAQATYTLGHTSLHFEQLMHKKGIDCVIMEVVQLCKGPARELVRGPDGATQGRYN